MKRPLTLRRLSYFFFSSLLNNNNRSVCPKLKTGFIQIANSFRILEIPLIVKLMKFIYILFCDFFVEPGFILNSWRSAVAETQSISFLKSLDPFRIIRNVNSYRFGVANFKIKYNSYTYFFVPLLVVPFLKTGALWAEVQSIHRLSQFRWTFPPQNP